MSYSEIINNYVNASENILSIFNNMNFSNKRIAWIDIVYDENILLAIPMYVWSENVSKSSISSPLTDWSWGNKLGTCLGSEAGRDATDEIDDAIWATRPKWHPNYISPERGYFTDIYPTLHY